MRDKIICFFTTFMSCSILTCGAWADITVTGKVLIPTGSGGYEPGIGVTVQQKDKLTNGMATDSNGAFTITVPDSGTILHFSYLSHAPKDVPASTFANGGTVTLEMTDTELDEVVVTAPRLYTSGDGCDNDANDRITAELALCSVHAYNIGDEKNPEGADKQLMKEIVALKTTVIAQQMNKQYEYMDAMLRRFRTQLEKAVLTTKLQKAGATGGDASGGEGESTGGGYSGGYGGGGTGGGTSRRGLASAEDCLNSTGGSKDALQCLLRNIAKIQSAVTSGDLANARYQLEADLDVLSSYNGFDITCAEGQTNCQRNNACTNALGADSKCATAKKRGSRREDITTCLGQMRACTIANSERIDRENNRQNR